MGAPGLVDALYLVSRGVPYEIAMRLSPRRRTAFVAIMGQFQGQKWNAGAMRFESPDQ
jgi:hypothetical protein